MNQEEKQQSCCRIWIMQKRSAWLAAPTWLIQIAAFAGVFVLLLIFWIWGGKPQAPAPIIPALAAGGAAAWGSGEIQRSARRSQAVKENLERTRGELDSARAYLDVLQRAALGLHAAATESQVMQAALGAAAELAGARGASLVPLDEWGQALPAYTYGSLPIHLLSTWNEHLGSNSVRAACRICRRLSSETGEAQSGAACPLGCGPFPEQGSVYCLPVQRGARILGMVNLYAPDQPPLSEALKNSLQTMLNEAAVHIEIIRLKQREAATLQQGQTLRSPRMDLSGQLGMLLEGLQQAVTADGALLLARGLPEEWQPPLELAHGQSELLVGAAADGLAREVLAGERIVLKSLAINPPVQLAAAPLTLPDGRTPGVILLSGAPGFMDAPRAQATLRSVADQAALMIDNERAMLSLEYRTIIQERARLAREIHDGLAQTLAFLKLQAAQMQIHLAQGSLLKLGQALKQNYDTLADAYLDTRQAIDNLRLTPQQGLVHWLEILLDDLQTSTGLAVERAFSPLSHEMPPEVQIQVVRILQEALNNVRKHASARMVRVVLREWNGDLVIEVIDDGRGFQPDEIPGISQYGLRGMRERAELIGADFQIISGAQQGTMIRLSIPLQPQETVT